MRQGTVTLQTTVRIALLAIFAGLLSGCSTYYQSYYPDSGVYYGDSDGYGHAGAYSGGGYATINPSVYPYWSIDYFYFSRYYHPYSVYVGYNEPLYYPYPGWVFGDYRAVHPRGYHAFAFGYGFPWHGYGYRYPAYSFGFFSGYDSYYRGSHYRGGRNVQHRIRHIDRRLEALQHGDSYAARRGLIGRDRVAGGGGYINRYDSHGNRSAARRQSRAELLRQRDPAARGGSRGGLIAPDRRIERRAPSVRSDSRPGSRSNRRSDRRPNERTLDRDTIRRDGVRAPSKSHRGIPIDNLSSRVIGDLRSNRPGTSGRTDIRVRDDAGNTRTIRRAPPIDWNRSTGESRQAPVRDSRRAPPSVDRGGRMNRSDAPPSRPARKINRPDPPTRASSAPAPRATMRNRSGDNRSGSNRASRRSDGGNGRRTGRRDKLQQ